MTRVVPLLASFCLCAATVVVAAPTSSDRDTVLHRSPAARSKGKYPVVALVPARPLLGKVDLSAAASRRRRSKREVFVEQTPEEDLYDAVSDQLRGLSDEQLQLLAEIVQNEMDSYNEGPEDFEVVEVPFSELQEELYPRDRRDPPEEEPLLLFPEPEFDDEPELVLVPEELVEETEEPDEDDDLELRLRIAELADLLNERAVRGL
uniref:Fibrous sheath-interacting protein 1 n=1 Tax=Steinernema glaseri TaxID=37863 RepID=A0A1I7ZUL7_9BILA